MSGHVSSCLFTAQLLGFLTCVLFRLSGPETSHPPFFPLPVTLRQGCEGIFHAPIFWGMVSVVGRGLLASCWPSFSPWRCPAVPQVSRAWGVAVLQHPASVANAENRSLNCCGLVQQSVCVCVFSMAAGCLVKGNQKEARYFLMFQVWTRVSRHQRLFFMSLTALDCCTRYEAEAKLSPPLVVACFHVIVPCFVVYVCLFVCLFVCLLACLLACLFVCLFVCVVCVIVCLLIILF